MRTLTTSLLILACGLGAACGPRPVSGTAGTGGRAGTGGTSGVGGTSGSGGSGGAFPAPVPDNCITNVSPGDRTYSCQGQNFLAMIDERCTRSACGLIFDVHGAVMDGAIQRQCTRLHQLAPSKGYIVVHPSSPSGAWNLQSDPPILTDFMRRMINAFHVDTKRVHITGFSMGSAMTFWFLCNHPELIASAGPVTGSSAEQTRVEATGAPCIASIDASWQPRVPILFMSGIQDPALTIQAARDRTQGIVSRLGLTGGAQVAGDARYTRKRWEGSGGMVFDFLEHNYANALIGGHCIPGEPSANFISCTDTNTLHWGQTVLQWFIDHPKP